MIGEVRQQPNRRPGVPVHLRRLRWWIPLVVVVATLVVTGASYLATAGQTSVGVVAPPPGSDPNGNFVTVSTMNGTVTRTQGNATLQTGVALAKLVVAPTMSSHMIVQVVWVDPRDGNQVLNNPNAQISVGAYYPIYQQACAASTATIGGQSVPLVTVNDGGTTICTALDQTETGSATVSSGTVLLHNTTLTGYVIPDIDASNATACSTTSTTGTTMCIPTNIAGGSAVEYGIASIVTPGGTPAGQQNNLTQLNFHFSVRPH